MLIDNLKLYQFRNLKNQEIKFSKNLNLVYGNNGEGKTNLLEAIYILSLTKSFRVSTSQDFISFGKREASVFADMIDDAGYNKNIGISFFDSQNKKIFINHEEEKSLASFIKNLVCVSFNPADILMIKSASQERRRFLDKHISDYNAGYLILLLQYKKALKNKLVLLKNGVNPKEIYPWNKIMADVAFDIQKERQKFLSELEKFSREIYKKIAPEDEELKLTLKNHFLHVQSKDALFEKYNNYLPQEQMMKKSLVGIHKDDLLIYLGNHESKKYASQGQARSILLSLKLGILELLKEKSDRTPVVLLDDIDSELDDKRREVLFSMIFNENMQVFISAVNQSVLDFYSKNRDDLGIFNIKNGIVSKES